MILIGKHIVNKSIRRTVLWAVLLFLATQGNSAVCESDTIIIDGAVIDLQIREVSEEELKEEKLKNDQTDSLPKVKDPKFWEVGVNGGLCFNKSKSLTATEFLNNYVSLEKIPGNFGSFQLKGEVWRWRRNHLKVGFGVSTWTQNLKKIQDFPVDSIISMNSPAAGELEYSIWINTQIGGEVADIEAVLKNQIWRQLYLEFPISYSFDLKPEKKKCLSVEVGILPGFLISDDIPNAHFVNADLLEISADNNVKISQFNFSSELVLRYAKSLKNEQNLYLQVGYRDNFKDFLSDYSLLDFSRKTLFLGVGFCFSSGKDNK